MKKFNSLQLTHNNPSYIKPVMWIRIDRMRIQIHKIWWMQIQIQDDKTTKSISTHLLKVKKIKSALKD